MKIENRRSQTSNKTIRLIIIYYTLPTNKVYFDYKLTWLPKLIQYLPKHFIHIVILIVDIILVISIIEYSQSDKTLNCHCI